MIDDFLISPQVLSQEEIEKIMTDQTTTLVPGQWNYTPVANIYGHTENWGYSTFMGNVCMNYPWVYQLSFGWLYHFLTGEGGDAFYLYNLELGWIYVDINHGGWFYYNDGSGWELDNFLNPTSD